MSLLARIIQEYLKDNHQGWGVMYESEIAITIEDRHQINAIKYAIIDIKSSMILTQYDQVQYTESTILPQITKIISRIEIFE